MASIEITTTYTVKCEKCKTELKILRTGVPKKFDFSYGVPELKGWRISSTNYIPTRDDQRYFTERYNEILCPTCVEKERQEKMKSENIFERANAGYYKENPDKFEQDVYSYFNIPSNHPKINKFWSLVREKDSYSERLSYIEELVDLLL